MTAPHRSCNRTPPQADPEHVEQFITAWSDDAAYFKSQPGFISTQLHRGIADSCMFLSYAVWESPEHFRQAVTNPDF